VKKITCIILVSIVGFFVAFNLYADDRLQERKAVLKKTLAEVQKISDKAKDGDLTAIAAFLRDYGFMAVPVAQKGGLGIKIAEDPKQRRFAAVPLLPGDEKISKDWAEAMAKNQAAFFSPHDQIGMLVLKNNVPMTELWKGFILIHEGTHVLAHAGNAFSDMPPGLERRAVEEVYAYTYEKRAIEAMVGKGYGQMVQEQAKMMEVTYRQDRSMPLPDYEESGNLDKLFGKPMSKYEQGVRWSTFWIHSAFQAIENIHGAKDRGFDEKVSFLFNCYKKNIMQ
jgi:hypothetical protein